GHYVLEDEPEAITQDILNFLHSEDPEAEQDSTNTDSEVQDEVSTSSSPSLTALFSTSTLALDQNIAAQLVHSGSKQPEQHALSVPIGRNDKGRIQYKTWTYAQLDAESNTVAQGLLRAGFQPGMRTVLMVPPGEHFFALVFAMFRAGLVPVVVDPGMGIRALTECLKHAQPEGFIGIPKAQLARILLGWSKDTIRHIVHVGTRVSPFGYTYKQIHQFGEHQPHAVLHQPSSEETAAVLFTSGSTGTPKGVEYTHRHFQAQIRDIRMLYNIRPGERDLCTFPLFALFSPALGMASFVPEMDASKPAKTNPKNIVQALQEQSITNLFGSPALLLVLSNYLHEHPADFPSLKRVISAGAPMPTQLLTQLSDQLPTHTQIFPSYGATEAMPLTTIESREILTQTAPQTQHGAGVCVGLSQPNIQLEIISIDEQPIANWSDTFKQDPHTLGEVVAKGDVVTHRYLFSEQATQRAKISDPSDPKSPLWHRMGDLGYKDRKGRLWLCGRKSQRVETPDKTYYTVQCEAIFNTHPSVERAALIGLHNPTHVQAIVCIQPKDQADLQNPKWQHLQRELRELATQYECTKGLQHFMPHPKFPVDVRHNAKIFREQLARWAQEMHHPVVRPLSQKSHD
ncbi:MAG: fatty acid CoA ligase family protein, partial [Myxococcota bacterium]